MMLAYEVPMTPARGEALRRARREFVNEVELSNDVIERVWAWDEKKNQLRVFFIYLIIFGVALFFVMLQIGLIEQFYSFFKIHHYFMPQILISVVLFEGLRLCSAIYYYEVLKSRNTKYMIACMISHPFFMILPAMFFLEIETLAILLFLSLLFKIAVNRFYYKRSLEKYD